MRYICKIIENDIPNIYMRLKNAEKDARKHSEYGHGYSFS